MKKFTIEAYPALTRRFFAMTYDSLLALAIVFISTALMVLLRVLTGPELAEGEIALSEAWQLPTLLFCLLNVSLFFCYFWVRNGQTLGMQAWRLAIVDKHLSTPGWKQAYCRFALAMISAIPCLAGYFAALFDTNKQTLHDRLSGTQTIIIPKKRKG